MRASADPTTRTLWFSRHHRGGDAMPHHRTLTPVVLRDWSHKLELLTAKEVAAFRTSEWGRPEPAQSPHLDTAAETVS